MVAFPNCKINLGLRITEKRHDGFHNLESVFLPLPWYDALEIIESNALKISATGIPVPGDSQNNLCIKAWHLLKKDFPALPPVSIYLHKTIPTGAGLGGGSSNGAFMLRLLNEKFALGIPDKQLSDYALQLGSDCPFFMYNKPALAMGRGEILEPVTLDLKGFYIVLINPGIHVPTGWAFNQIIPALPENHPGKIMKSPPALWSGLGLKNDFEARVLEAYPEIASVKQMLIQAGALYASMTGTGSTCYGIFNTEPVMDFNTLPGHYMLKKLKL